MDDTEQTYAAAGAAASFSIANNTEVEAGGMNTSLDPRNESLGDTVDGRPPTVRRKTRNKQNTDYGNQLNGLSDLDAELNFPWGDSTDEKPDGVTQIFFQCERNKRSQRLRCGFRDRPQL
jgi:hypothetical protein